MSLSSDSATERRARIGILISGRGSNMVALADAVRDGGIPNAEIAIVISDQTNAAGLAKAAERGIETLVIERRGRPRAEHDREIVAALNAKNIDLVCLAGYLRMLSPEFIAGYRGRILNIHPSLLPAFPGLEAQRQALEAGVQTSRCNVHFFYENLGGGPKISQRGRPVHRNQTPDIL